MAAPTYIGIQDSAKSSVAGFLLKAAATDFWHDFHHAKSQPILDRLGKSYNITSSQSKSSYLKTIIELRQRFAGTNLYDMFKGINTKLLLLGKNPQDQNVNAEDKILNELLETGQSGITYEFIRNKLIADSGVAEPQASILSPSFNIATRPYSLISTPVKNRGDYSSVPASFSVISNGAVNYILMIDASFLSMTRLRTIAADESRRYRFFIIQSVENEGDPATKIGTFESDDSRIEVYFLKDESFKTYYTPFNETGQASNLFSGCSISAYRDTVGTITADLKSETFQTTIDNIGTSSEPSEAGFLAFQKLIEKGFTNTEEAMAYFLMKRAGDWCQALCLLDRGRQYTIEPTRNSNPISSGFVTLEALIQLLQQTGGQVEVGLLTHDKILLSYALLLGLNVFFTIKVVAPGLAPITGDKDESSTSVIWLLYFKNQLDTNPGAVKAAADEKWATQSIQIQEMGRILNVQDLASLDTAIETIYNNIASTCVKAINAVRGNQDFILFLSSFLTMARIVLDAVSKVGNKPPMSINTILTQIQALQAIPITDIITANNYFSFVSSTENYIHSYLQIASFEKDLYQTLTNLSQGNTPLSFKEEADKISELARNIYNNIPLTEKNKAPFKTLEYFLNKTGPALKRDLDQVILQFDPYKTIVASLQITEADISGIASSRAKKLRFSEWYDYYKKIIGLQAGGQVGGNTSFDNTIFLPLQENKINIRPGYNDYNAIDSIRKINGELSAVYTGPQYQFILPYVRESLNEEYAFEQSRGEIKEPVLTDYLSQLMTDYIVLFEEQYPFINSNVNQWILQLPEDKRVKLQQNLSSVSNQATYQQKINNFIFDTLLTYAKQNLRPLYLENNNLIDIGSTITFEDGVGYTAVDYILVTWNQSPIFEMFFNYLRESVTNPGIITTHNPYAYTFIFYRYLIYNLDTFTNNIYEIGLTTNDNEPGLQGEPYYSGDNKLRVQKIWSAVESILSIYRGDINTGFTALFPYIGENQMDVDLFVPNTNYKSRDEILAFLAVAKILVINQYYNALGKQLNKYQMVRLIYLLSPSIPVIQMLKTVDPSLSYFADVAIAFQYLNETGNIYPGLSNEYIKEMKSHLPYFNDEIYYFPALLTAVTYGGKKQARFQKTRSQKKQVKQKRVRRNKTLRR